MSKIRITRGNKYIDLDQEELKLPYDELQNLIEDEFNTNARSIYSDKKNVANNPNLLKNKADRKNINRECHETTRSSNES